MATFNISEDFRNEVSSNILDEIDDLAINTYFENIYYFESKFHFANIAAQTKPISDHHGLKYLDKGKALRYFKAIKGDEKQFWINAHSDELDRLINRRKSMRFIKRSDKEKGRVESYWNPQLTKKSKNGEISNKKNEVFELRSEYLNFQMVFPVTVLF
jgi:hypothetical protein